MLASPADVTELQRLWNAYRAAADRAEGRAAAAIVEALSRIAGTARQPTQDGVRPTRLARSRRSSPPEQLAMYREWIKGEALP